MQAMRILHALHGFPPEFFGGSELYVRALALAQARQGHDVAIVAGTNEEGPSGRFTSDHMGLAVYRLRRSGLFHERWDHGDSPSQTTLYRDLLEEFRPDLVHVHHWKRLCRDLVRIAHSLDIPTVLTLHDLFVTCPRVFRVRRGETFCERPLSVESCLDCVPTEEWMGAELTSHQIYWFARAFQEELSAASALIVPSRAHAEFLAPHVGHEVDDFAVLPHGSILSWPSRQQSCVWDGEGPLRIAHWGHLQELKGVHILAEALSKLEDKSRVQLVLWGTADDPEFDKTLNDWLVGVDVERRDEFSRDDLARLQAHVAVFPTLAHESHSFVLDEAFALGLPVLASARGALPERVHEGGLVFPAGDATALATLLQELLDMPAKLEEMGRVLPEPLSMGEHWQALEGVYIEAANRSCDPLPGQALARARRYEELVRILEARCREIEGLREKATSEAQNLEKSLEEFRGSLAGYRNEIRDKEGDLEQHHALVTELRSDLDSHRALVQELRSDLENHKSELARAQKDFEVTEAALVTEREQAKAVEESLARECEEHEKTVKGLTEALADADRLLRDLEDSIQEVARISGRMDDLEKSEARLQEEKQRLEEVVNVLEKANTRYRRENRLALPLVLPARLLLAIKDRLLGPPDRPSPR